MATTTLELIFSGLLLLSLPEGDGKAVVVFPEDEGHQLNLVLLKGSVEGKGCEGIIIAEDLKSASPLGTVEGDMAIEYPTDSSGELRWKSVAVGPLPKTKEEVSYISWLPSLSMIVNGESRLRSSCRYGTPKCQWAKGRFFLDRGDISACHLVHDPPKTETVQIYELPNEWPRALADTFVVKQSVAHDAERLLALTWPPNHRCELIPTESGDIVLFISNAPRNLDHAHPESHFTLLHQFHYDVLQRGSRERPLKMGDYPLAKKFLGSCEESIDEAHKLINCGAEPECKKPPLLFVHSPNECGTATQP